MQTKEQFVSCSCKGLGEIPLIQSPAHTTWAGFETKDPSETTAETQEISIYSILLHPSGQPECGLKL